MKKNIMYILGFILTIVFLTNVEAASNTLNLSLTCPKQVNPGDNINCSVYAEVTGNNVTLKNIYLNSELPIKNVKTDIEENTTLAVGKRKLGTLTGIATTKSGAGRIEIAVDAKFEDGEPLFKYSVEAGKVINVISSSNTLNSIKIDGTTVPNFSKNTTSYYIDATKSSVNISAISQSTRSTVSGTGTKKLRCGNNTYSLIVKAENGSTKKYNITINRKCSNNAYLKGITLSSGTLSPAFKEDIYKYTVKLDKDVEKITVKGIKDDASQIITGEVTDKEIKYGKTTVSLVVKSQTGVTKTYNIILDKTDTRDDNSKLSALSLSSGNIQFDPNTLEYETKVLYTVNKIEVLAVPEKETSTVKITGNDNLKVGDNLITISVKSEKGKTTNYKIKVIKLKEGESLGDNANIKNISVKGYDLPFTYNRKDYKLVIKDEEKLDITVLMDDPSATYEIKGNENLKDGRIIEIVTNSLDGTSKTYTIEITKTSYTVYFIIAGALVALAIAIPIIVYFSAVKKKKELLDVNGYKIGKEYEDKEYSRKVIGTSQEKTNNVVGEVNPNTITNNTYPNPIQTGEISQNSNLTINNNQNEQDFDAGLQDYVPNESTNKCPNCGRELMGNLDECPYCKTKLK